MSKRKDKNVAYLDKYAGIAGSAGVLSILHDRENIDKSYEELAAILVKHLDGIYEILGRGLDDIEDLILSGEWSA